MKPKLKLITDDGTLKLKLPPKTQSSIEVDRSCPACGIKPVTISGTNKRIAYDDKAYESDALSVCCNAHVGTIRLEVSTLFGLREDEAVLKGRNRVY